MKNKLILIFIFLLFAFQPLIAQTSDGQTSSEVTKVISTAFKNNKTPVDICNEIEKKVAYLQNINDRLSILVFLANYEESLNFYEQAAKHFSAAALLASLEQSQELMLNSAKAYIQLGNIETAISLISSIEQNAVSNEIKIKASIYKVMAEINSVSSVDSGIKKIKQFVTNSQYVNYHPMLLFSLWWIDNDKTAKNTLLKRYPNSLETAVINGVAVVHPSPFWYLMPRFTENSDDDNDTVVTKSNEKVVVPDFVQVGFYKTKEYAEKQHNELKAKGFDALIKIEMRKNVKYYAVIVKQNKSGNVGAELRNAGYDSSPIF